MDKEPITLNGLNKLKEEIVFLKEKKLLKQDLMEILKKMLNTMPQKRSSLLMKVELQKLMISLLEQM